MSADSRQWHLYIYQTGWSQARWYTAWYLLSCVEPGSQSAFNSNTDISWGGKSYQTHWYGRKGERRSGRVFTCSSLNRKWPLCPKAFVLYYTQHLMFQKSMSPWYSAEALTPVFNRKERDIMPCSNGTQKCVFRHESVSTQYTPGAKLASPLLLGNWEIMTANIN